MNNISSVMAKYARNAAPRANDLSISPSSPHFVLHQPISQRTTRTLPTDQLANPTPDSSFVRRRHPVDSLFREFFLTLELTSGFIFLLYGRRGSHWKSCKTGRRQR